MQMLKTLLQSFFTHKDFLPPPKAWPGTLFTPLQIIFCTMVAALILYGSFRCAQKSIRFQKKVFFILWLLMALTEPAIAYWDAKAGKQFFIDWTSALSLWPCSIFLYVAPFAIFGRGKWQFAACGYICTLGLLGGMVNFVYPATYISTYSCLSMAGLRTIFYHGAMIFTAVTMLLSGYHSFRGVTDWQKLLLPMVPLLAVSIPAHIANLLIPNADYLFFRLESFFFAPIGRATPDWFSAILVYILYLIIHCGPYLPSYVKNRRRIPVSV